MEYVHAAGTLSGTVPVTRVVSRSWHPGVLGLGLGHGDGDGGGLCLGLGDGDG